MYVTDRRPELTPREREILNCVARGMIDLEIAKALGISRNTVRNHMSNILEKLDVHSRWHAVAIAFGQDQAPSPAFGEAATRYRRGAAFGVDVDELLSSRS